MGDNTDVDLGAPLLEEHSHDHDITLNGDSINLRDLLLGGNAPLDINHEEQTARTPSPAASDSSGDNKSIASNKDKGVEKSSPGSTTDPSSSTLSLDDNRSSFTATEHHITRSIRRGQSVYYRAKRKLSNLVAALSRTTRTSEENNNISHVQDGKNNSTRQITQKSSLSSSKSTSPFLKLLIPPLLIFNHFIFYQAQTKVSTSCVMILHTIISLCTHFSPCSNINVTTNSADVESCILDQCNHHCYGYDTEIKSCI